MSDLTTMSEPVVLDGQMPVTLCGVPEGLDALVLADLVRGNRLQTIIHVARDEQRLGAITDALAFFAKEIEIVSVPGWDCLPYDRVSPSARIMAERLGALTRLATLPDNERGKPRIVLTTVNAIIQRLPPVNAVAKGAMALKPGTSVDLDELQRFLQDSGFSRTGTVVDRGDYAVRGGIVDVFSPGTDAPVRLDFFGDTLESIRTFDVETQRTRSQQRQLVLEPGSEVILSGGNIARFRTRYKALFADKTANDPLYEAVKAERRYQGIENWLPLFYETCATLPDFVENPVLSLDHLCEQAIATRFDQINDYYKARQDTGDDSGFASAPYNPLAPEALYLSPDDWQSSLSALPLVRLTPFDEPEREGVRTAFIGGKKGHSFAGERARRDGNIYEAVVAHTKALKKDGKKVVVAGWSAGSRDRLSTILEDHKSGPIKAAKGWSEVQAAAPGGLLSVVLALEAGFETPDLAIIAEQDILGDRLVRRTRKTRRAADFIAELSSLEPGDLVVHVDHGIARFEGLKTIDVTGAPHDCLHLSYAGDDRLFLPVENIELLSRYGSEETGARLDKLGGGAWQARKAKLKKRVMDIAADLIATAAARELQEGAVIESNNGLSEEFAAGFAFTETDDQLDAIDAIAADLVKGRPMDRLVCGDVGFGKTEVAMRAAFAAAMTSKQVAVVVPTTLLARQHYASFRERFENFPVTIAHMSRLVDRKTVEQTKKGLQDGTVDIVIGTHALLAKDIKIRDLSLLIIDEEQRFGVKHKERLKELRANIHVLTLTATPIPRTLQLAMSGVRELSLITTPPADRLAVRTFISPFDPVTVRETLLRELYRGGQSFYVVPRIADIGEVSEFLRVHVPELKVAIAHGQMSPGELEDVMNAFYDRKFDVLLATTIIESGIDIASANTLVVHRSNMFGLAQLYQLRGRVGRSKHRAYALFTVPPNRTLTDTAEKRLKVLQSLDTLGAGFSLASHDLDIRGAGNLVGEEQSGHIKEVGFELYQDMLEEAVSSLRDSVSDESDEAWSPQINIGTSVLIPENYVEDLQTRLGLYRRLSDLHSEEEINGFAAELHDRFGRPPVEVEHLLKIVVIKELCRSAHVASLDAGAKGAVIGLRDDKFPNPPALLDWINKQGSFAKIRPDMKLVVRRSWDTPEKRLVGARQLIAVLVKLAQAAA